MIPASRRGTLALAGAGLSVCIMAAVAAGGPSAAEPVTGPRTPLPPWSFSGHPYDVTVIVALWASLGLGTAAVLLGLSALRDGWRPRPRRLLAGSALGVALLAVVPPVGSTDLMDYSTYGRIATLGHSPYVMSPLQLRETGDPVAAYSSRPWRKYRSVYGPLATGEQWAASKLGKSSAARTTFVLKLVNALAFLIVALVLDRMAPRRLRLRAHVLWTINPLMLWGVVGGGHVDGLAMAFAISGLWLLTLAAKRRTGAGVAHEDPATPVAAREPMESAPVMAGPQPVHAGVAQQETQGAGDFQAVQPSWSPGSNAPERVGRGAAGLMRENSWQRLALAVVGGALLGCAAAIKVPFLLIALGPAWTLRRLPKVWAAAAVGLLLAVVPGYLLIGRAAYKALQKRSGHMSELSFWHLSSNPFGHAITPPNVIVGALTLALVIVLLRGLPDGQRDARIAMAFCLAWVIPSAVYFPWYEVMTIPLLALLPATKLDWLVIARAGTAALGAAPGMARFFQPTWVNVAVTRVIAVAAPVLLLVFGLMIAWAAVRRSWPASVSFRPGSRG